MKIKKPDLGLLLIVFSLLCTLSLSGCTDKTQARQAAAKPPEVYFTVPVYKEVSESEEFTGRTESDHSVEMRARVTGYLDKVNFKDGAEVKLGEVLFEVDPRLYQAELDRATAAVAQTEAKVIRLDADFQRAEKLLAANSMSKEDYDKVVGDRAEATANVKLAKAQQETAKLNLSFTKITAPFSGLASRRMVDPGNLVKQDETLLTTIVSLDPMFATFDVDERTVLKVRRLIREGKLKSARETAVPISIGLPDEDGYSVQGTINFVDNRVDPSTGTLRVRGVFANPNRLFSPGVFVRVLLRTGPTRQALVVPDEAFSTDQGSKYLNVLNDKNIVQYRKVKVGPVAEGGLRVVEDGISTGERIIVTGLQRVRPGIVVDPKPIESMKNPPALTLPADKKSAVITPGKPE
jgi:RND family efflux transporter MFP subunit